MKSTSVRLPEPLHNTIENSPNDISTTVRKSLTKQLTDQMVGKCAITGDILYTFSDYMVGEQNTPIADALNITDKEPFLIRDDLASQVSRAIASGKKDEITLTAEYYNELTAPLYHLETLYLDACGVHDERYNSWAREQLMERDFTNEDVYRATHLFKWLVMGDTEHMPINDPKQMLWDALSDDVKENIRFAASDDSTLEQLLNETTTITYPPENKANN